MCDELSSRLCDAAADPSHTPDFARLAARGRVQRLAGRAGTAVVAIAVLVAGGLALWPDGPPPRAPLVGRDPAPAETSDPGPDGALPEGWTQIRLGEAMLGVPGDWRIESFSEPAEVCENYVTSPTAFVLRGGPSPANCDAYGIQTFTVTIAPMSTVTEETSPWPESTEWPAYTTDSGLTGERLAREREDRLATYRFAELDLWVQFQSNKPLDGLDDRILATLTGVGEPTVPAP